MHERSQHNYKITPKTNRTRLILAQFHASFVLNTNSDVEVESG